MPENAKVIDYYYYHYCGEARDEYLELKLETEEETEDYLEWLKAEVVENLSEYPSPQVSGWFYAEQNPYNSDYTDMLCLHHHVYQPSLGEKPYYIGYSVTVESDKTVISAIGGIISYSIEEKTVIQTFFYEYYNNSSGGYFIPKYFTRF